MHRPMLERIVKLCRSLVEDPPGNSRNAIVPRGSIIDENLQETKTARPDAFVAFGAESNEVCGLKRACVLS